VLIAPLTERILRRLGRPKWVWICAWAVVPLISPVVFSGAIRISGREFGANDFIDLVISQAVLAFACLVLLIGSGVLSERATLVKQELANIDGEGARADLFRGMGSAQGPLALTAVVVAIISANGWASYGPLPPLAALPFLIIYVLAILTFVWTYLTILVDLHRLGREPLSLDLSSPIHGPGHRAMTARVF
jgi:hypothetical protein